MSPAPPPAGDNSPQPARSLRHLAVIMDGNGRWAQRRALPRQEGHIKGLRAARELVENIGNMGVPCLTLFAFSNENWNRPKAEVSALLRLFADAIERYKDDFCRNGIKLRFIGDASRLPLVLQKSMAALERLTGKGDNLRLNLAIGYSGRWDIINAARRMAEENLPATEENFEARLATAGLPPPDLLIRTGGEQRISNFMLWQAAYTELYFTETLWPDFNKQGLNEAVACFCRRERRYGLVQEQA